MTVYDKAKWHFETVEELGGDREDAFAPAAYFFAWMADHGLLAEERAKQLAGPVAEFRSRELDGVSLFKRVDGVLHSDDLSGDGDRFATAYFDYRSGSYLADLRSCLPPDVAHELTLGWRWPVYDALAPLIRSRHDAWVSGALPEPR